MAESTTQDRTEKATPKRVRDARQRGELPRSRELVTAAVVGAAVAGLSVFQASLAGNAASVMRNALTLDPALLAEPARIPARYLAVLGQALWVVMPLLAAGLVAALAAPMLLGGWNISAKAATPDLSRLNPVKGLGRIFSMNSLVELAKGLVKFSLLGGIAAAFVWSSLDELLMLAAAEPGVGIANGLALGLKCLAWLTGGLMIIAGVDAPYQVWTFARKLRMTRQEVRDEFKESEGRPEVKARIRRLQQEISQRRMMEKVPAADVVVTNPTHYAVALQYTSGAMRAPKVVAKGADLIAQRIRELAVEHKVPIVSAPPLARALYRDADLDREIPIGLYSAVAQVLTYVYQLRAWRAGTRPVAPVIGEVPNGAPDPT